MFTVGSKVIHPLHGLGVVESIENEMILGQDVSSACIVFDDNKLKIKINLSLKNSIIRPLIDEADIDKVIEYLKSQPGILPVRSSDRYALNMKKLKSGDIYQLAEIVRDLTAYSLDHKLPPKEAQILKQARHTIAAEFGYIKNQNEEIIDSDIDKICRRSGEECELLRAASL